MIAYTAGVEQRLNECLFRESIPDPDLVEKIAVCKIRCILVSINRVHALQQEVGSYALMHDTGFELSDMLLTCKFAEGDSRILQQVRSFHFVSFSCRSWQPFQFYLPFQYVFATFSTHTDRQAFCDVSDRW